MIGAKRVLAVIPARGGSKGVPRKNLRQVCGKPLLAFSVEAARESRYIDLLIVSTEDPEIQGAAQALGVTVLVRPDELAQDDTPGVAPVLHAVAAYPDFDYVVLLQPTSPQRSAQDIDGVIEHCLALGAPACVSVCEARENPYSLFELGEQDTLSRFLPGETAGRRQDLPPFYRLNGAVYVADIQWLIRERDFVSSGVCAYRMPVERSLDIDTEDELGYFAYLRGNAPPH